MVENRTSKVFVARARSATAGKDILKAMFSLVPAKLHPLVLILRLVLHVDFLIWSYFSSVLARYALDEPLVGVQSRAFGRSNQDVGYVPWWRLCSARVVPVVYGVVWHRGNIVITEPNTPGH